MSGPASPPPAPTPTPTPASKPALGAVVDISQIGQPPPGHNVKLTFEPQEPEADQKWRLTKERTMFWVGLIVALLVASWCAYVVVTPGTAEEKRWPQSVLTLLIGGFIGYWTKK